MDERTSEASPSGTSPATPATRPQDPALTSWEQLRLLGAPTLAITAQLYIDGPAGHLGAFFEVRDRADGELIAMEYRPHVVYPQDLDEVTTWLSERILAFGRSASPF